MTLTLVSTVGGSDSNSYGTIADVNVVAPFRPTVGTAWLAASSTPDVQAQGAVMATQRIDQSTFKGEPSTGSQSLQFPRVNLNDRYGRPIDSGSIPSAVKSAWISLSMWYVYQLSLNATLDPLTTGDTQSIQIAKAGDAEVQYFAPAPVSDPTGWNDVSDLPPDVVRFLNQFLAIDPMAVSISSGWVSPSRTVRADGNQIMQFPSRSTFRNALAPLTKAAAENLGSRVTVKRDTVTRKPDNSVSHAWASVATNVAMRLSAVTEQRLQNIWGIDSSVTSEGSCTDANDVQSDDVIVVTSGDFTGEIFQVIDVSPSPLSGALAVGLATSTQDVAA